MKNIYSVLFLMLLLLTGHTLSAQLPQMIGFTQIGGANNLGILYKINYDGSSFTPVYSFASSTGYNPAGVKLTLASNNILYGLNQKGGANSAGCLFSFDPVKNIYKDIIDFNGSTGYYPRGGLVLANNGLLYGTTSTGGSVNTGVIFSFDPVLNKYTVLYNFDSGNGHGPDCTMLQASDGQLYGTTTYEPPYAGTIYSFNIATNAYTLIYTFGDEDHTDNPVGSLVEYNRVLYGFMDEYSMQGYVSKIYDFNLATKAYSDIYISTTALPTVLTPDLFGTTFWGLNTGTQQIYTISTKTNSYNSVYTFPADGSKGLTPKDGLLNHNPNKFYGITNAGGSYGGGVLYTYYLGVNTKLHDFTGGAGGAEPYGVLTGVPCTQKPAKPGTIAGSGTATCNKTKKYTINRVSGATSYKWTVPVGAKIQGAATDTVITVLWGKTSGDVAVQASNTCGTSAKQTKKVTVSCSAKELIADDAIAATAAGVTPNPTTGNIAVHFTSNTSSKYTVNVIDVAGKVLLTREVNAVSGSNTLKFDLSKLAKGIYYIQLSGEADKQIFKVVLE